MFAISLLALVFGALVGFLVSNLVSYAWTLDGLIYLHRWAATVLACFIGYAVIRVSAGVVSYFFDSRARAEKLAAEKYETLKADLAAEFRKAKATKDGLNELYERHSELNRRIDERETQLKYQNRQFGEKLLKIDELLAELDQVYITAADGPVNDGRRRREQGKVDKIKERAEALKKEVVSERG